MSVPVHIISGFLGVGKTTTLRAQLEARRHERVAVIVNDFGEAGLDEAALAEDEPFRITNIPGGCVCCTAPEGFVAALGAVLEGTPDRLLIEPTGLARPQDLIDTIRRCPHGEGLALAPVLVLVDPARLAVLSHEERAVVDDQLAAADVVVANRTDLCSEAALADFDARVAALWPEPLAVHRTRQGRIPSELMEWPAGEGARLPRAAEPREASHAHSTRDFRALSLRWPPTRVFSRQRLLAAIERLRAGDAGAPLARLKGVFRTAEGVIRLEVAGEVVHEEPTAFRRDSRADVILRGDAEAALEAAAAGLEAALLSADELAARAQQIEIALPDGRSFVLDHEAVAALPDGVDDVSALFPKRAGSAARLAGLWESLGLPRAGSAVVCAADGFASEPVTLDALRQGLLLHSRDGAALGAGEGGPFRLLIPEGVAGAPASCANVKGVVRIAIRADSRG